MKQSMKALLVAWVLWVSATACMTHAEFNWVTYDTAAGTITITHDGTSITMKDKNVWATEVDYGESASTASYGNYYQWWWTTGFEYSQSASDAINKSWFVTNNNTWNTTTASIEDWWKWPCPSGYHVPTSEEWKDVVAMYTGAGNDKSTFADAFKLPFAGYRDSNNAEMSDTGDDAELWSASPTDNNNADYLNVPLFSVFVSLNARATALPVRCFANSSSPSSSDLSAETEIILTIEEWQLSIGTDGEESVTLSGGMAASLTEKIVTKSLEKLFRVEDLKWSSKWYRTTISVTDMTWSVENAVYTIPAANIYLKATNLVKESWTGEDVVLTSSLSDFQSMEEPVTFIQRGTWTTAWLLWKYGATPELKVVVPANMPGTTYKWTITYTLYENE